MTNGAIYQCGLNDCCWSFVLRVDRHSTASFNSVTFPRCKPYFCHDFALKLLPELMFLSRLATSC